MDVFVYRAKCLSCDRILWDERDERVHCVWAKWEKTDGIENHQRERRYFMISDRIKLERKLTATRSWHSALLYCSTVSKFFVFFRYFHITGVSGSTWELIFDPFVHSAAVVLFRIVFTVHLTGRNKFHPGTSWSHESLKWILLFCLRSWFLWHPRVIQALITHLIDGSASCRRSRRRTLYEWSHLTM